MAKKVKTKEVKYYLDETDQIEVDGHTLSRLYLAPDQSLSREFIESLGFAIYGEDNSDRILGGHVESLKNLSTNADLYNTVAWVDQDSEVYGNSLIGAGCFVCNSSIINSAVRPRHPQISIVSDSTIVDSAVRSVKNNSIVLGSRCNRTVDNSTIKESKVSLDVKNSTIINSEATPHYPYTPVVSDSNVVNSEVCSVQNNSTIIDSMCNRTVDNSTIKDSTVRIDTYNSTVANSYIMAPSKLDTVVNANLDNIQHYGGLSGTFSGFLPRRIKEHTMSVFTEDGRTEQFSLLQDSKGNFALRQNSTSDVQLGDTFIEQGDIDFDELYTLLNRELNGKPIGHGPTLDTLEEIKESMVLTDSDLDFGDELTR